jgi:sugar lactone lactonase YvrE
MPFGVGTPPGMPFQDVSSTEIPGVIAAGQHWRVVWQDVGMADGIVAFDDGSVWLPAMDASEVLRIDRNGKTSVIYRDTYTGAALAANSKGQVFIAERALGNAVWMLKPQRRLLANTFHGEPFDCVSNFINDVLADSKGGVYMTMDGLYYINPKGAVLGPFGTIPGNGLMLSVDEKTFYATGRLAAARGTAGAGGNSRGGLVAYDVQSDGSLTNERQFAETCGDGLAVDAAGRIYCTVARIPDPADPSKMIAGIGVISPEGKILGIIPQPRGLVTLAFGGPDKKTLFAEVNHTHVGNVPAEQYQMMSIQMIAQGNRKRPK